MNTSKEEIREFLEESVNWLIDQDMGCSTLKLDDRLAICVGWLPGYGKEKREDCIQSKNEPDFAINAGIKVYTSDDMRTDYEFINAPYYKDGDVIDTDVSIEPNEDYDKLANYFIEQYGNLEDLEIDEDGEILDDNFDHSYEDSEEEPQLTSDDMNGGQWYESLNESKKKKLFTKDGREVFIVDDYDDGYQVATRDGFGNVEPWQEMITQNEVIDGETYNFVKGYKVYNFETPEEAIKFAEEKYGQLSEVNPSKEESLEENKLDEMAKLPYHVLAWKLFEVAASMNDEEAYYNNFAYVWPDGETRDQCKKDFNDAESYNELKDCFERMYKAYHKDGLYTNRQDILDYAHKIDAKLGLEPIKNFGNIPTSSNSVGDDPYDESLKEDKKEVKESWEGESVIDDLIERAQSMYDEGGYGDIDDCVAQAIDDGLIYTDDIRALADHYGVLPDDSDLIAEFYEYLRDDVYAGVEEHEPEEEKEDDWDSDDEEEANESLKEDKDEKHYQTLKDNDCDLIALTEYEGGDPVDYVKSDEELQAWLDADEEHSWFPVEEDK